jgi:S-adenosylmethionine:tRNA ribosyltransferase-isomerase
MGQLYRDIRITDYSYDLPDERIAKYPLPERDQSRLLVWDGSGITDTSFSELPSYIGQDNLLVFNNTKVIRARLRFRKESGAQIEVFCLEPHQPYDFARNLSSSGQVEWKCLIGNLKRWKTGPLKASFMHRGEQITLTAERMRTEGDAFIIRFSWDGNELSFADVLSSTGHMPIPPYLRRDDEDSDVTDYQTLYARIDGSVASPTAGLHFTPAVFDALEAKGVHKTEITLHVSAGTFRPVKSELICDHMMHTEHFFITTEVIKSLIATKITAVGTTSVRALESLYWLGLKASEGLLPDAGLPSVSQWDPYENNAVTDTDSALCHLLKFMEERRLLRMEAKTDIIIVPGYRFRLVNSMVTNFHQPRSTLLLLVAAFTGNAWKEIYDHALSFGFRFLSYGDSMLLTPAEG